MNVKIIGDKSIENIDFFDWLARKTIEEIGLEEILEYAKEEEECTVG